MFAAALLCCGSATVVPGNSSLFKGRIVKGFRSLFNAMALVFMTTPEGMDETVSFPELKSAALRSQSIKKGAVMDSAKALCWSFCLSLFVVVRKNALKLTNTAGRT